MMKKITFYLMVSFMFVSVFSFAQGLTTGGINGRVLDDNSEALTGVNVIATHTPSGTTYGAITDFDGFYRISNMRTGGPYSVVISYVGFAEFTENDVYLSLGNSKKISTQLSETASVLGEVVITGQRNNVFDSNKTGTETTITKRDIKTLPSVSRSIADFVRVTPSALITEGNDGFSISLSGQNNRYNAIYIDGAVNNDVFGLAGSGTNGGQTGVNPFSVDAIETFQVNIAPFDVKQSGFSGGSINAVTRSGTNLTQGSVYGFVRNQDLAGKTPPSLVGDGDSREKLDDFSAYTYGIRVGGPIIKDKLFYFINYERQDDETPQPFNISNYDGRSTASDLAALSDFLINTYGYDPGIYNNNTRTLQSDKLTAKIDFNLDDKNKFSLRHSYVKGDNVEARNSGNNNIGFINGSESFITTTNSTAFEWSYNSNKVSNNLVIGFTSVRDDRDPAGDPFPTVEIQDGSGEIEFGAEPFSTANLLNQDVFTVNNNFQIYSGRHTITLGANLDYADIKNLFFAFNYGFYTFEDQYDDYGILTSTGLNQFMTGQNSNVYQHGYSLLGDGTVGDESAGASEFTTTQIAFYAQDEVQMSDNFKLTYGIRLDLPYWDDGIVNDDFNNRTIPLLEAHGKNLQGAKVGQSINPSMHLSPRLGFNWDVNDDNKTQVRGGLGIFTSRLPLVWPGGTYNNNGVTGGFNFEFGQPFEANVNNQYENPVPGSGGVGGNIDLIAQNFKLPQVMKYNIAIDQQTPFWGLIASAEFLYTDIITDIYYENLNLKGPVGTLTGVDSRPYYDRRDEIDDTYGRIMLASNTGVGYSYNASATIRKPFSNGFQGQISYSYGDSFKIFDGTSSQNSSQWRNIQSVNGKNSMLPESRSDFSLGSRISSNMSYELKWSENVKTTIGIFYEGLQGNPFSYVYREGRDVLNDDSRDNALIYIPASSSDINLVDLFDSSGNLVATPEEQWTALNAYIEGDDYLRSRRGDYAERNGDRGVWNHVVDLKFLQDFSLNTDKNKHSFQISLDIFNFTNLINKDWGVRYFTPRNVGLLTTVSGPPDTAFTFDEDQFSDGVEQVDDSGLASSRWQMQIGLRYLFN